MVDCFVFGRGAFLNSEEGCFFEQDVEEGEEAGDKKSAEG